MHDVPFLAVVVAEEFGTGEVEEAPAVKPAVGFSAVAGAEGFHDGLAFGIVLCEPGVEGFLIVASIDVPARFFVECMSGGEGEEVGGGHDASGKEVTRHPIVGVLGFVKEGVGVMSEDMDEDFGVGLEPGGDLGEELTVVANVLEHFNRDEAVKGSGGLEVIDIAGDDFEVMDATGAGLCFDVLALGLGIGNGGDFSAGVARRHEEAKGTPTTAQFEDVLPVAKLGAFASEGEHRDFRCFEGIALLVPVGGTVFEVGAEGFEEIVY